MLPLVLLEPVEGDEFFGQFETEFRPGFGLGESVAELENFFFVIGFFSAFEMFALGFDDVNAVEVDGIVLLVGG